MLAAARAGAQGTAVLQTDATVMPKHRLGMRLLMGFTRFDELLGEGGTRNIAAGLRTDSLNGAQIPQLGLTQDAIRSLSGVSAFSITAGNIVASANSRVVTAPLILEYGLTNRLTLGLVVPLVETRSTVFGVLNPKAGAANVGVNPGATTWSQNSQLVSTLRASAAALKTQLASCQANASGAGCATLLQQQASAQSLIDATEPFASALEGLYGVGTQAPGSHFVPINNSVAQEAIIARITTFRAGYQSFGRTVSSANPTGAAGPAGYTELQQILAKAGYDSLQSTDHSSIGDITIGGTYQLANTFGDTARTRAGAKLYRFAVNAGFRIGTGQPAKRNRLFDNPTGYGQAGLIVGGAADLQLRRRFFFSGLGSYTMQLGTVNVARASNAFNAVFPLSQPLAGTYSAGDVIALTAMPRYRLAGLFTLDGIYTLSHIAADEYASSTSALAVIDPNGIGVIGGNSTPAGAASATAHQVGFGFSYSSALADANPGRFPYEASFRHVETIAASGGPVAKTFTDQIQLRVFFR